MQPEGFVDPTKLVWYSSSRDPIMDCGKHLGVRIFILMRSSLISVSSRTKKKLVYAGDILLIGNDVSMLKSVKNH